MEKTENSNQKPILVKIAKQLLKDQQELDHLAVQLSLGKVEAKDEFEKTKSKLKSSVHEFKVTLTSNIRQDNTLLNAKLEELEEQLDSGIAKTKEVFLTQKKNILKGIDTTIIEIEKNKEMIKSANFFTSASKKIRLQLEILEKNMGETKTELTSEYNKEMMNAQEKINDLVSKIKEKQEDASLKWENFKDEIHISYEHLKKAIQSL